MPRPHRASRPIDGGTISLSLDNPSGTLYDKISQTQPVLLSSMNATPGGWALVLITSNGDSITVPDSWILYGGDALSIIVGNTNHIQVFYKDATTIYYTNKVTTP